VTLREIVAGAFVGAHGRVSTSRVCGVLCYVTACIVALWHPDANGTVTALCGAGAVAIAFRSKAAPVAP
jgi:hypothetical protein